MELETIREFMNGRFKETKERKIKKYAQHVNRASSIGDMCLRFLYYSRVNWEDAMPHDWVTQSIFDEGNLHEQAVINTLEDMGFIVFERQVQFNWKKINLSGHIDGKIMFPEGDNIPSSLRKAYIPFEAKSISPYRFDEVNEIMDFANSKHFWEKRYPAQVMTYLFMEGHEVGVIILKNKLTGVLKFIPASLDYGYMEKVVRKCEYLNYCVDNSIIPLRYFDNTPDDGPGVTSMGKDKEHDLLLSFTGGLYDDSRCSRCEYRHLCLPDKDFGEGLEVLDSSELLNLLVERERLKGFNRDYMEIDKQVKKMVRGKENLLVGDFHITGKMIHREGYNVDTVDYWRPTIRKIT